MQHASSLTLILSFSFYFAFDFYFSFCFRFKIYLFCCSFISFSPAHDAMRYSPTMPSQDVCLSVRLSVRLSVYPSIYHMPVFVKTARYILKLFSPLDSHTILVFFPISNNTALF